MKKTENLWAGISALKACIPALRLISPLTSLLLRQGEREKTPLPKFFLRVPFPLRAEKTMLSALKTAERIFVLKEQKVWEKNSVMMPLEKIRAGAHGRDEFYRRDYAFEETGICKFWKRQNSVKAGKGFFTLKGCRGALGELSSRRIRQERGAKLHTRSAGFRNTAGGSAAFRESAHPERRRALEQAPILREAPLLPWKTLIKEAAAGLPRNGAQIYIGEVRIDGAAIRDFDSFRMELASALGGL